MENTKGTRQMKEPTKAELKAKIAKLEREQGNIELCLSKFKPLNLEDGRPMVYRTTNGVTLMVGEHFVLTMSQSGIQLVNNGSEDYYALFKLVCVATKVADNKEEPTEQELKLVNFLNAYCMFSDGMRNCIGFHQDPETKQESIDGIAFEYAYNGWCKYIMMMSQKIEDAMADKADPKADKEALDALRTAEAIKDMPAPTEEEIKAMTTKQK